MAKRNTVFKIITNEDIYGEIKMLKEVLDGVLIQTKKTNSRVDRLEDASIGCWVKNHPFKFAVGCTAFVALFISDFRHPVIEFLKSIIL